MRMLDGMKTRLPTPPKMLILIILKNLIFQFDDSFYQCQQSGLTLLHPMRFAVAPPASRPKKEVEVQ